jgi:hypothetical protein
MMLSKTIGGLVGPTLVAIAIAILLNVGSMPLIAAHVARDPALILLSGILLLVAGIAMVRAHNVWSGGWPVLVTIVGWLALLGGLARMFFPIRLAAIAAQAGTSRALLIGSAVVLLLLGAFLSYKAYSRE